MNQYRQTDLLLHLLAQVLAKFNLAFVPAGDDDSHTLMTSSKPCCTFSAYCRKREN
jgi:hypothetical protein